MLTIYQTYKVFIIRVNKMFYVLAGDYMNSSFNKNYFYGCNSNVYINYEILKYKIFWINKIIKLLKYKRRGKLLDVGCAFGYFALHAQKRGFDVYGIDISSYAIKKSLEFFDKNKFFVHDVSKTFPFKNNFFDVVTAFDVIEHVRDYKKVIKNIFKVLKRDGVFLLSVPIKVKGFLKKLTLTNKDRTHVSVLTEDDIKNILIKNKLKIQEIKYYYLGFPMPFKKLATNVLIVSKK